MIKYVKGNLFDYLNDNMLIVHSCNCKGVWGSGFAKQMKEKFPLAFNKYERTCKEFTSGILLGFPLIISNEDHKDTLTVCLMVSDGYGKYVDSPASIKNYTLKALRELLDSISRDSKISIISPKFNSGLFNVPWNETEEILNNVLNEYKDKKQIEWTVVTEQ